MLGVALSIKFWLIVAAILVLAVALFSSQPTWLKSLRSWLKSLGNYFFYFAFILLACCIFLDVFLGHGIVSRILSGKYFWVGLIGLCVGAVELVARYRDDPQRAIRTIPAIIYMLINVVACLTILYILNVIRPSWLFGEDATPDDIIKHNLYVVLTAGFGAVALFRSSIFKIKTNDGELSIGPAVVLDTVLRASDRAVDRIVAQPRGISVADIMKDVSFERAKVALPLYCFGLMQNVSQEEQKGIGDQVNALATKPMEDKVRALSLGLALINVVGVKVLRAAVSNLGELVKGDPPIEQREVAQVASLVKNINYNKAVSALPPYCFSLIPTVVSSELRASFMSQMETLSASPLPNRVKTLILGLSISNLVGYAVLKLAIEQLGSDIQ
jgi:hypothetical protein